MSREIDWKIHEYMGNDLTGYVWMEDEDGNPANFAKKHNRGFDAQYEIIPHYSTTWEGAGLVMEWLEKERIPNMLRFYNNSKLYWAQVDFCGGYEDTAPMALCKAYISAMEERGNG